MSLITGTPPGTTNTQESLYIDGAPSIFFQDYNATIIHNPDANGLYWGMSGTATYPVKELDCITDSKFMQGITANDIQCDTVGVKGTIQRRNYVQIQFSLQSLMPLSILTNLMGFSPAVVSSPTEQFGMGAFDNNQFWHVYAPKVYNETVGDYLFIWMHKCQFVEPGDLEFRYGEPWMMSFSLRGYADTTYPSTQQFGSWLRSDLSVIT